jgi:hypothetical protein
MFPWQLLAVVGSVDLIGVDVETDGETWMGGANGEMYHRSDSTETFSAQTTGTGETFLDVSFADTLNGWAVGQQGIVVKTVDGGATWDTPSFPSTEDLYEVLFVDGDSTHLVIVATTYIYESTNGGDDWSEYEMSDYTLLGGHVASGEFMGAGFNTSGNAVFVDEDVTAPATPSDLTLVPSSPTSNLAPDLMWLSSDDESGIYEYVISIDGVETDRTSVNEYEMKFTSEGSYDVTVYAIDVVGNQSSSGSIEVIIDSTAPTVGSVSSSSLTVGVSVTLSATVTDAGGMGTCELFVDGISAGTMSSSGTLFTDSYTFSSEGDYAVALSCEDAAGNTSVGSTNTLTIVAASSSESGGGSSESGEAESLEDVSPGALLKLACGDDVEVNDPCTAVYYYSELGQRHAFPNSKVFFSWYDNFSDVVIVDSDGLSSLPLGMNVTYRPGVKMVKFLSWNTVYTVSPGAELRAIPSEEVATDLYGSDWNTKIDDISDAFFSNYSFGTELGDAGDYDPDDVYDAVDTVDDDFDAR